MKSEIAAAGSMLRRVDNALPSMQTAVAALGPSIATKADETQTQLARVESSISSSVATYQALLSHAISVADQRNATHERKLRVSGGLISIPATELTLHSIVSRGRTHSTSSVSTIHLAGDE